MRFFLILICFCLFSCGTSHCIKIGGEYQGISGDVEYCYNPVKSSETGRPVLDGENNTEILGITEADIKKIVDKITSLVKQEKQAKQAVTKKPQQILIEFLKESSDGK